MTPTELLVRDDGAVRILTINRPAQRNALNQRVLEELQQQIDELQGAAADDCCPRAVIITGAGERAFAAGADIRELESLTPAAATRLSQQVQTLFQRLRELRMPVIAAVNGHALGGGLELALACDFIYASEHATLGLVEVDLGLIPGYSGVSRLTSRIGESQAREALLTARRFTAEDSYRLGLVNRVLPATKLLPTTLATAHLIAGKSATAVAAIRQLMDTMQGAAPQVQRHLESLGFGRTFADADAAEGLSAFLEKRPPRFGDR